MLCTRFARSLDHRADVAPVLREGQQQLRMHPCSPFIDRPDRACASEVCDRAPDELIGGHQMFQAGDLGERQPCPDGRLCLG